MQSFVLLVFFFFVENDHKMMLLRCWGL